MFRPLLLAPFLLVLAAPLGCGSASDGQAGGASDLDTASDGTDDASTVTADQVRQTIAGFDAQRASPRYAPYYQDGLRAQGCWQNPAGNNLTDLQKAFYCAMPLEFRVCNSVVLLQSDDSQIDQRLAGYMACQSKVNTELSEEGFFTYDDTTNEAYEAIMLRNQPLSDADSLDIISTNKPPIDESFLVLLPQIIASVNQEASDLDISILNALYQAFQAAGGQAQ